MNKYIKIGIILATLVIVIMITDYFATQNSPFPQASLFEPRPLPFDRFNGDRQFFFMGDMELYYKIKVVLSSINATLLVILLVTYVDMYKKIKSEFTIGLILFSLTLLSYALTSNPLLQGIFGFRAFGLGPFAMLPDMFTSLALAVLLYLTMK
jgi:hypothetical protein